MGCSSQTECKRSVGIFIQNRLVFGNLELSKVDESDPTVKLSGAEFTVTKPNGAKVRMEEVLDRAGKGTGVYRLEGLPYGRYTVQETKAPEGYELNQAIFEVNITEEKTYVVQADGFEGIPNRQQVGSLTVHKVDFENRPLSGVTFLLEYSEDGAFHHRAWRLHQSGPEGRRPYHRGGWNGSIFRLGDYHRPAAYPVPPDRDGYSGRRYTAGGASLYGRASR